MNFRFLAFVFIVVTCGHYGNSFQKLNSSESQEQEISDQPVQYYAVRFRSESGTEKIVSFNSWIVKSIQQKRFQEFVAMTPKQVVESKEIVQKHVKKGEGIVAQNIGAVEVDMRRALQRCKAEMTSKLEGVFLPHQNEAITQYQRYLLLQHQGLVGSIAQGDIRRTLNLSNAESEQILRHSEEIRKEYVSSVAKAQEHAIKRLTDQLSYEKQNALSEYIEPLAFPNGSIVPVNDLWLQKPRTLPQKTD
jgi:uncharacterized protein YbjQ (UPF0145 family)